VPSPLPENDNARKPVFERRREPRRRALLTGKIVYIDNGFTADCRIRDLSVHGARIVVAPEAIRGDPFLIVVKHAMAHQSRAVWRVDGEAGLQFVKSIDIGAGAPLPLKAIRNMWAELAPR